MITEQLVAEEIKYRRIARTAAIITGILLLVLTFMTCLSRQFPPPGQEGILVAFGEPDMGEGDDQPMEVIEETQSEPEEVVEETFEEVVEPVSEPIAEATPTETAAPDVVTQESPEEIAFKKAEEKRKKLEELENQKLEQERIEKERIERERLEKIEKEREAKEAKRKAAEAERKRKEAEAKALEDQLNSNLKGAKSGKGRGDTGKSGNQGDPNGGDSNNLKGSTTGLGDKDIGGGLSGRGVAARPNSKEQSQFTGKVVVQVCVDQSGNVVSAKKTNKGTSTTDLQIIQFAEKEARKFKFKSNASAPDRQCGTITFDFTVK